jgi:hypothetical protein
MRGRYQGLKLSSSSGMRRLVLFVDISTTSYTRDSEVSRRVWSYRAGAAAAAGSTVALAGAAGLAVTIQTDKLVEG